MPVLEEHNRKNFQGRVEEGENKGGVERNSCDCGFSGEHYNGPREVLCNNRMEVHFDVLVRVVVASVASLGT